MIHIAFGALGAALKGLFKGLEVLEIGSVGNRRTNRDYPNNSIEIGENTEKSPEDLRRLTVTQTPVKEHQVTLV